MGTLYKTWKIEQKQTDMVCLLSHENSKLTSSTVCSQDLLDNIRVDRAKMGNARHCPSSPAPQSCCHGPDVVRNSESSFSRRHPKGVENKISGLWVLDPYTMKLRTSGHIESCVARPRWRRRRALWAAASQLGSARTRAPSISGPGELPASPRNSGTQAGVSSEELFFTLTPVDGALEGLWTRTRGLRAPRVPRTSTVVHTVRRACARNQRPSRGTLAGRKNSWLGNN